MAKLEGLMQLRKESSLTQKEMASFLGVSLSMYEKVERGYMKASRNFMDALKKKYPNADIGKIFFDN